MQTPVELRTKVQMLTPVTLRSSNGRRSQMQLGLKLLMLEALSYSFTCFTGTYVQMLTPVELCSGEGSGLLPDAAMP